MFDGASYINIRLDGRPPYNAGERITGAVEFNNTSGNKIKFRKIYVKFYGARESIAGYDRFFEQIIPLEDEQVRKASIYHIIR